MTSVVQPPSLLAVAEGALARGKEIAPIIDSKCKTMAEICAAFPSADEDSDCAALAALVGLEESDSRDEVEAMAWKILLTLRIEVDMSAGALARAVNPAFKAASAAQQQRHIMLNQVADLAGEAQRLMVHYAGAASNAGGIAMRLLQAQGVELEIPVEMQDVSPVLAANGAPAAPA